MARSANGTRMIRGREYLLNGTVSGWTAEETKANLSKEVKRLKAIHTRVYTVRRWSCMFAIYTHG